MTAPPSPTALPPVAAAAAAGDGFLSRVEGSATAASAPLLEGRSAAAPPRSSALLRRVLAVICVIGTPITNTALTEYGQYMETRLAGGSYKHGYAIAWLNHSVLIVFLIPWAIIVTCEQGCSCGTLWRAMAGPYRSGRRLVGVTFWLAFQYQLFNYGYWSWLPLASASSAQTISQSQCIFAVLFATVILKEPSGAIRWLLVLLCVAGVCVLTYGDSSRFHHHHDGSSDGGDSSGSADDGSSGGGGAAGAGSMLGDLLLIIPSAFNALYAVEWKRLVPGAQTRDSLVGLGLLAAWHLVFWVWGMALLNWLHHSYGVGWAEPFELPDREQAVALGINAALATASNVRAPPVPPLCMSMCMCLPVWSVWVALNATACL
jgi:uncharacterized membrane protein YgcG